MVKKEEVKVKKTTVIREKKLYRSRRDYMIGGVCGGIAEYFEVDPTIVRLIAVLTIFLNGLGLLLYVIFWIIIPQNPYQKSIEAKADVIAERKVQNNNDSGFLFGLILILIGVFFLLKNIYGWVINLSIFWPLLIITIGILFLIRRF